MYLLYIQRHLNTTLFQNKIHKLKILKEFKTVKDFIVIFITFSIVTHARARDNTIITTVQYIYGFKKLIIHRHNNV